MIIDKRPEKSWQSGIVRGPVVGASISWKVKPSKAEFLLLCVNEGTIKGFYSNVLVL